MSSQQNKREENEFLKKKKESRCQTFKNGVQIPNSYKNNTLKEELILEHVIQFKKEFGLTYDAKRELLLHPQNECGKYKFICTTIRPTKVPYPELYDYKKCAKFISEFFEYEELNPPTKFPEYIPAPDNVVKWQIGDCFDLSIVLASLLIGAGYNAYVIYGKAPRFITSKDETLLPPPEFPDEMDIKVNGRRNAQSTGEKKSQNNQNDEEGNQDKKEDTNPQPGKKDEVKPTIPDKEKIFSKFDEEEKKEKEEEERLEIKRNTEIDDDMPELERNDPYKERRIHCWVMIRKCARLKEKEEVFIEPSTGRLYNIKDCPYEKVDALFNDHNFYINLHLDKPIQEIDWNFSKATNWEYVMLNAKDQNEENNDDKANDEEQSENNEEQVQRGNTETEEEKLSEILDMPPPWPNKIMIPLQKYNERSPTTTQVFFYKKTKIEKFAPCSQADGMTLKIYNYHDYARFILTSVEIRYRNRGDKLYKRMEYPYEHKSIDFYLPGQKWHWKRVEEVDASYKKIDFYPTNFETGLVYREEIFGEKILHRYKDRDDKVFERKVLLNKNSKEKQTTYRFFIDSPLYIEKIFVYKFTQKTSLNPLLAPEGQVYKLSYRFEKGTSIQVINHYGKGKILSKPDIFSFEDESSLTAGENDESSKKIDDDREIWKRSVYANKGKYIEDFKKIEDNYNRNYMDSIEFLKRISENRKAPAETNKVLYEKGINELPILEKSIFDIDSLLGDGDQDKNKNDYTGNQQSFDRIAHFLEIQKKKLEEKKDDHEKIKEDIIKAFKDEKTTVTNVLQNLLNEQVKALQDKIDTFKNRDTSGKEEIEKHNIEVNEIQRKINIIYQRSHKHITKIMEELNELLEKMDENFAKDS